MITADQVRSVLREIRKLPFLSVYPGDWLRDPVAGCSLAAQGLWLRMMFVMHDAQIYGHLADAWGKPLSEAAIMRSCGVRTRAEYRKAFAELVDAGVPRLTGQPDTDAAREYRELLSGEISGQAIDLSPMRTDRGDVIYSKRMVRDHRLRVIRRLVGKLGAPSSSNLGGQNADSRARPRADTDLDSEEQDLPTGTGERVQGEGRAAPDFDAVARIDRKLAESSLRVKPSLQIVTAWLAEFDESLILETLVDAEASYRGKGYQYLEQILATRRADPSQRPHVRRSRKAVREPRGNGAEIVSVQDEKQTRIDEIREFVRGTAVLASNRERDTSAPWSFPFSVATFRAYERTLRDEHGGDLTDAPTIDEFIALKGPRP